MAPPAAKEAAIPSEAAFQSMIYSVPEKYERIVRLGGEGGAWAGQSFDQCRQGERAWNQVAFGVKLPHDVMAEEFSDVQLRRGPWLMQWRCI